MVDLLADIPKETYVFLIMKKDPLNPAEIDNPNRIEKNFHLLLRRLVVLFVFACICKSLVNGFLPFWIVSHYILYCIIYTTVLVSFAIWVNHLLVLHNLRKQISKLEK